MPAFNRERWQVVSPHLDRALEMTAEERSGWLLTLRAQDATLADDIAVLLDEREALSREGFLEVSAPASPWQPSLFGQTLGAYTLVSQIGQGGMGSVWLANRSDGRFAGQAAVKLLNASLIGRAGEERFQREGQILARLRHPHIAHLIDAGVSPADSLTWCWSTWTASASTPIATRPAWTFRRACDCSWTCSTPWRTRTRI
jgi:hypothetical protein